MLLFTLYLNLNLNSQDPSNIQDITKYILI